jgi:hypothetical protein
MYYAKILIALLTILCSCRRSVHRPHHEAFPEITTYWHDLPATTFQLKNSHLEPAIFNVYDEKYLMSQQLPDKVSSRHAPHVAYDTRRLIDELEAVVTQLQNTKKKIKKLDNFIILKQRDYNYLKHTGLMVLRHKEYPFVIKLFRETPANFVKPFNRGIEECAFFVLGGGMNRYLAGFTRIPNRNEIQKKIDSNRYWSDIIETPRKWFWQPKNNRHIAITGKNIGTKPQYMLLPSIYAIVCDAIESDSDFSILDRNDRDIALSITDFLGIRIDPHINNFMKEKDTQKIIIIDTEHFPTLIGIKDPFSINDFFTYYSRLAFKFFGNKLLVDKKTLRELQTSPRPPLFPYDLEQEK